MFGSKHPPQPHNNTRFYIVGITILIVAIFVFFFLNNEEFSGATVAVDFAKEAFFNDEGNLSVGSSAGDEEKALFLTFDQIPAINTETKVEALAITFSNPSTAIRINNDRLELGNLKEVDLTVKSFFGDLALDGDSLSLDGTAKQIQVNNVVLSSDDELEISFQNLNYRTLDIEKVGLPKLKLAVGAGELHLAEKLIYILREENVDLDYFQGSLFLGKDADTVLRLEGTTTGLSISGEAFDLNLK
ncbi:MAG TPA: hypothetical protein VJG49_01560 [Candidatus Nanoarchaeia archaeon]|nr:hypothetical protein [Candidatus Nanoarchaeia archaeon]